MIEISLRVNGKRIEARTAPRTTLVDLLREDLLLTGTHIGCEHGICGACTVEIDGEIARSCITYAVTCDGAEVRTIEGFDDDPVMARLRQAFREEHALQCGYCTPGMLIAARDLVRRKGGLSRADIRSEMSGNLCRCTGYMGIVTAIERVMAERPSLTFDMPRPASNWLGPAPGPRTGTLEAMPSAPTGAREPPSDAAAPAHVPHRRESGAKRDPIRVTVGNIEETDGTVRLAQSFVLEHPRETVWRLMSDPQAVSRCLPGAMLDGPPQNGKITGRMEAALGPISARFAGEGVVRSFPSEYRQIIEGHGADRRGGSRMTGSIDYRLSAISGGSGGEATRVDVVMSYALTGVLATIGRSGLARDLLRRIGETFAETIDAQLRDPAGPSGTQPQLEGFGLFFRIIAARVRLLVAKILRSRV